MVNSNIIVVQAAPKTQPGGVQGAFFNSTYHSFATGLEPISNEPSAKAPKFKSKKSPKVSVFFIFKAVWIYDNQGKLSIKSWGKTLDFLI